MDRWQSGVLQKGSYLKNFNVEDSENSRATRHSGKKLRNNGCCASVKIGRVE